MTATENTDPTNLSKETLETKEEESTMSTQSKPEKQQKKKTKTTKSKTKKTQSQSKKKKNKQVAPTISKDFIDPAKSSDNFVVALSKIELPEKWNRESPGNLGSLITSIKTVGQISALVVRNHPEKEGKYILVDGRRRYMALQELNIKEAHVTFAEGDDAQSAARSGIANVVREPHNPMEMARLYENAREDGYANRDIARMYGMSQGHVSQHLALLDLDATVQKAISKDQITMSQARVLCKVNAEEHSAFFFRLFDQMINKNLDAQSADDKAITYLDRYAEKQREKEARQKAKEQKSSDAKGKKSKESKDSSTPAPQKKKRGRPEKSIPTYDDAKIKPATKTELKGYLAGISERLVRATSDKTKLSLKGELRGIERCAGLRE